RSRHTRSKRDWSSDVCSSDLEELKRKSNKEWKERRTVLRDEVRENLETRPDIAVDGFFAKGQFKLHPDFLTEEQKALLPKEYIQIGRASCRERGKDSGREVTA